MNLLRSMFLLLLMLSPLGANGEILRAAHREASDFNRAWNGGSQTRNAPFWQFTVDDPGSPGAKILRTDLSSPNPVPQEWGAAPQAEQHTQPIFAHNRVIAAIQTKGGWRVVSSDANSPAPQWLDMGEAPVRDVEALSINGQDELIIVGRNNDNAPATWQGAFRGGGMGLSWQQHDPALSSGPQEKALMGEFDLGDGGRMLSLTWNPKQSSVQMQYRTSPAAGAPYSAWSQPVQSDATQLNKRGRFLQYRLIRSDGLLVSRDQIPPIEVAYSHGEDENGADKNQYDKAPGGVSGSGGGLNVDSSSDLDDMSGTNLGEDASANGSGAASPSANSSSGAGDGATSSKPGKSSPSDKSKTPNAAPKSNSDQKPTSQNKTPSPQNGSQAPQQQKANENPNTNPANKSDTPEKNAQPGSEKEKDNKQDEKTQRPDDDEKKEDQENKEEKPESDNAGAPDEQQSNTGGGGNNQSMKSPGGGAGAGSGSGTATGNGNSNADQGRQQEDSGDGANANGAEDQSPSGQNASPANAGDAPEDEGENTPAKEDDEPDPASAPPPTMVPFANPGSIPLSSLLGSSMAPAQKEQAPKLDDARGGGDASTAPDGGLPTENIGDELPKETDDANGSDEEREANAGSPLGDRQQDDAPSKRFGPVRPGFGGGGGGGDGGSGRSSNLSTSGRTARATDEIEYATAPVFANMKPRTGNSDTKNSSGWLWLILVAALTAWLAYRVRNQRNRKREMEELQAQQAPRIVPQKLIDETYARQGAWEEVTHFIPDVQAVAIKNGTRYAVMSSGDVWKEPEQSNAAQPAPLKHVGRFAGEWLNAHLSVSDNALFFLGKDASGHLQGGAMPLRQINAKPLAFTTPKGLQDVQRVWFHKSRLWLQGDVNGEPAVYSAMADAAGVGGWVQETPNKFDAADSVCVSSGASMFFAGSPKQDREHLWLYTGENRTRGRLDWKPAAKTAYQGGEVFLFGDAKKCFMVEFDSQRPHLWFHVFGRGDEGEFLGRFTKEFDMPASARVFESHVSNGHLVLAGRDPETNRVVHLQAKVKTLLGVNQN